MVSVEDHVSGRWSQCKIVSVDDGVSGRSCQWRMVSVVSTSGQQDGEFCSKFSYAKRLLVAYMQFKRN